MDLYFGGFHSNNTLRNQQGSMKGNFVCVGSRTRFSTGSPVRWRWRSFPLTQADRVMKTYPLALRTVLHSIMPILTRMSNQAFMREYRFSGTL